ncbi:MAG: hypothetical protein R2708_26895 [Vicinamibacterales bacterium]
MQPSALATLCAVCLIAAGAGGARAATQGSDAALIGRWGGDRIRIDGSAAGSRIQVDCLLARTDDAIALDASGAFSITVSFVPIRGVALDGQEERPPSRVTGRVEKDVLRLSIGPADGEPSGSFTLERNGAGRLPNCRLRG